MLRSLQAMLAGTIVSKFVVSQRKFWNHRPCFSCCGAYRRRKGHRRRKHLIERTSGKRSSVKIKRWIRIYLYTNSFNRYLHKTNANYNIFGRHFLGDAALTRRSSLHFQTERTRAGPQQTSNHTRRLPEKNKPWKELPEAHRGTGEICWTTRPLQHQMRTKDHVTTNLETFTTIKLP